MQAGEKEPHACNVCVPLPNPAHAGPRMAACWAGEVLLHTEETILVTSAAVRAPKQATDTEVTDCFVTVLQSVGHV